MLVILKEDKECLIVKELITHVQKVPLGGTMIKTANYDIELKDNVADLMATAVASHNAGSIVNVDIAKKTISIIANKK